MTESGERVIVFSVAPLWSPHFETELDIALMHRSRGDDVEIAACQGFLESCLANPNHKRLGCMACRSRFRSGLNAIELADDGWSPIDMDIVLPDLPEFSSLAELRDFEYRGVRVGRAAASSLVSLLRDSSPDLAENFELTRRIVHSAIQAYEAALFRLKEYKPTIAYIFNGRFASTAPIVDACELLGIPYKTHEAGYGLGTFLLTEGRTVHDLDQLKDQIEDRWAESEHSPEERDRIAREFFVSGRFGGPGAPVSRFAFASQQDRGAVPTDIAEGDFVAIFNSSEDEFAFLSQFSNPVYADQQHALASILGDKRLTEVSFVLRVHPNLAGLTNSQTENLERLNIAYPNLTIIEAEDPTDTYALMEQSKVVITFGSTTGIEAVYWGVPSILVGRAPYEDLACTRPSTHDELVQLILKPPSPSVEIGALKYGFYMRTGFKAFWSFKQVDYDIGVFDQKGVRPAWQYRAIRRVRNRLRGLRNSHSKGSAF